MAEPSRLQHPQRRYVAGALALAAGALLAGLAGWSSAMRSTHRAPNGVVRLAIPSVEAPAWAPFGEQHLAIANDGLRVAYTSANKLWIRGMDANAIVTVDANASFPFFSPDDEWVAYFTSGPTTLKKVPVRGGLPVTIAVVPGRPDGATWAADGTIVFATSEGMFQVADSGGDATLVIKPDPEGKERAYACPQFMPGGRVLLFTILPEGPIEGAQTAALDIKTRAVTLVLRGASSARYVPTGHLLYASGQALHAIGFDPRTLRTRGDGVPIPDVEVSISPDNGSADFAVSDSGTLVSLAAHPGGPASSTLWWLDRRGNGEPLPLPPGAYTYARISPDGTRVALDIPGKNRDIWIADAKRPNLTRLTSGPGEEMTPVWSPTGRVFFASQRGGNFDVYSQAPDGATPERVEFAGPGDQLPLGFTPDGTALVVNENFKDLSLVRLARPPTLVPLLHSDANEWLGEVSPDGNWVAYESDESGDRVEIFVRPLRDVAARREKVSIDGGRYPMWSRTGTGELFYVDPDGAMMAASITLSPSLVLGGVTKLFDLQKPTRGISGRRYDVSSLDGRFLVIRPVAAAANRVVHISVVLNWFDELRRLLPGR